MIFKALLTCFLIFPLCAGKLKIPRWVSIRAVEVNVRVGPGVEYPREWVFKKPGLPVEVIAEFETWRKIRTHDNIEGWVHQSMLSGRRYARFQAASSLYKDPVKNARITAKAHCGVIGKIEQVKGNWCKVTCNACTGWVKREALWGLYPTEEKV